MHSTVKPASPPFRKTEQGETRRVGVEIEFASVSVREAARMVHDQFGGTLQEESAHRINLEDTDYGTFTVELDTQLVHGNEKKEKLEILGKDRDAQAREALGYAASLLVPAEIVAPPIPWNQLGVLNALFDALRQSGAEGTEANPLFSFGLHLNPEVAEKRADYARQHLQAYVILSDWLRDTINVDPTRRLLPHIDPFPKDYIKHILQPGYAPDLETLIRDYVASNSTRNRELDMTVLFHHLDEDFFVSLMDDVSLINARPTFHYRLPNAILSDPDWNAVVEWNRWVVVETLAADETLLATRAADYLNYLDRPRPERWIDNLNSWFDQE